MLPLLLLTGCRTPVSQVDSPDGMNDYDPDAFATHQADDAQRYGDPDD